MSKKSFKRSTLLNRVFAIPTRKRKNADGTETQLYRIVTRPRY